MNETTNKNQISQGAMANKNGKIFEKMMIPVFENNACPVLAEKKYLEDFPYIYEGKLNAKNDYIIPIKFK